MRFLIFLAGILYIQIAFAMGPTYISLGSSCQPAFRLTECQLRLASYPFDWIISPFDSTYMAIEDDFTYFFKDLILATEGTETMDHYGLYFHHVWREHFPGMNSSDRIDLVDWKSKIGLVEEKLYRRVDRFKKLCASKKKIVFVRYDWIDKSQAEKLRNLIKNKYPNLMFVLMVVKPSDEFREPWNLENIENFSIEYPDTESWRKAFEQVAFKYNLTSEFEEDDSSHEIENFPDLTPDGYSI